MLRPPPNSNPGTIRKPPPIPKYPDANSTVEFLFLGRGVQAVNKKQKSAPQFREQIDNLRKASIPVKVCKVSLQGEGLSDEDIFENLDSIFGAVEVDNRIKEGYSVITF